MCNHATIPAPGTDIADHEEAISELDELGRRMSIRAEYTENEQEKQDFIHCTLLCDKLIDLIKGKEPTPVPPAPTGLTEKPFED